MSNLQNFTGNEAKDHARAHYGNVNGTEIYYNSNNNTSYYYLSDSKFIEIPSKTASPSKAIALVEKWCAPQSFKSVEGIRSLSLVASSYFFQGTKSRTSNPPAELRSYQDMGKTFERVALGTEGSFYTNFESAFGLWSTRALSSNFSTEYPNLMNFISATNEEGKPDCLSLGNNHVYFARWKERNSTRSLTQLGDGRPTHWLVPQDAANQVGDMNKVDKMWFGANDAYIILKGDGTLLWGMKGGYDTLAEKLRSFKYAPLAIALDLEHNDRWFAVWPRGGYSYKVSEDMDISRLDDPTGLHDFPPSSHDAIP